MSINFVPDFKPDLIVHSPGRINLIGEHTDYNMGYVLPMAIDRKITFGLRKNQSAYNCNFYSTTYGKGFSVSLKNLSRSATAWENYLVGVLFEISKRTAGLKGFDCILESDLPAGSGLSSSAALECGLAFGLNELFYLGLSPADIITLSRDAEHSYVGTQCGIMDQFASVMGRENQAILLDCKTLEHDYIPIALGDYKIVLLNSHVSHNLASSEYNTRRKECETGVTHLQIKYPQIASLREASMSMLEACKSDMSPIVYKRCKFIIEENKRVLNMAEALRQNNLLRMGELLYQGHHGLSKLYEIGCPETDFLVAFTKDWKEVLGARQMGGGFGGCTINIVHKDAVDHFVERCFEAYFAAFNITLTAFDGVPSQGTYVSWT